MTDSQFKSKKGKKKKRTDRKDGTNRKQRVR